MFDRKGRAEALRIPPGVYLFPRVSPDGSQLAFESTDGKEAFVAIYDLAGTSAARRVTYGSNNHLPIWSRDGKHIVYQSDRGGDRGLFWQPVDSAVAERLTRAEPGTSHVPEAWSPTEDVLLFNVADKSKTSLWMLSLGDRKPMRFGDVTSTIPTDAAFSPDGRWVAYQTASSIAGGEGELFVQPFPPNGIKHQVGGGLAGRPLWSRDGKELFYVSGPGRFGVVSVTTEPTFAFTDPVDLPRGFGVSGPLTGRMFDITREGRILGLALPASSESQASDIPQIRVVLNWTEELKQRVPSK
jgi:Tol biopolymer transport system component